jgi:hypothetical protein
MFNEDKWSKEDVSNLKNLKNVTIRGIDSEIYEEFSSSIKSLNMNIGDAITRMMADILEDFDGTFPKLSSKRSLGKFKLNKIKIMHHDFLSINKADLVEGGVKIYFMHIQKLRIGPDVDLETFNRYIGAIQHCDIVEIPNILPKVILLSKTPFCDRVRVYSVEQPTSSENLTLPSNEEE